MQTLISQASEQNDWQEFKPLFGGGKIKICDTLRAVTPFGGLSVFIEFLGRIGLVEQLASQAPYQPKSGNHYDPGQILVGFILSVIAGAQRFAHANQLRADRALHALLGMERFPSDDTIWIRRFFRVTAKLASCLCKHTTKEVNPNHRTTRSITAIMIMKLAMHDQANRSPTRV